MRIMVDILEVIRSSGGAKVTELMRDANMPYDRLMKYLRELEDKGLIVKRGNAYHLTAKGVKFLEEFDRIKRFFDAFGIEI